MGNTKAYSQATRVILHIVPLTPKRLSLDIQIMSGCVIYVSRMSGPNLSPEILTT